MNFPIGGSNGRYMPGAVCSEITYAKCSRLTGQRLLFRDKHIKRHMNKDPKRSQSQFVTLIVN